MRPAEPPLPGPVLASLMTAAALVALPVAFPPELHPWSRAACGALTALAAIVVAACPPRRAARAGALALYCVPLLAGSILAAACRARALDEAALLVAPVVVGLLGWSLAGSDQARRALVLLLAGLGCAASIEAAIQHHRLHPELAALLRSGEASIPGAAGGQAEAVLRRLEDGRPMGPFALPAALGGFLACTIPATAVGAVRARPGWVRTAALGALLLQGYALALSGSFGGLLAAAVGLMMVLPLLAPGRVRLAAGGLALAVLLLLGGVLVTRWSEIDAGPGGDPLSLRLGNWGAAARMTADHPLFGVGPGSFGTFYPRYMRPGMNETRFAHNSYLQLVAGWGAWVLLPIGILLALWARDAFRAFACADRRLPMIAGAGAFLVHNLVDFTLFLPGVALPAALLLGLGLRAADDGAATAEPTVRKALPRLAAGLCVGLALGGHAMRSWRCETQLAAAAERARAGDFAGGVEQAHRAAMARPDDPDAWAFTAQLVLAHGMDDPRLRAAGERAAARAVALDPEAAILHFTRSLYHRAAGELAAAYRETRRAHILYPLKPLYSLPATAGEGGP